MKGTPANESAMSMGLSSITSLLYQISNNTTVGNTVMKSLHNIVVDIYDTISAGNFINPSSNKGNITDSVTKSAIINIKDGVFVLIDIMTDLVEGLTGTTGFVKNLVSDVISKQSGSDIGSITSAIEVSNVLLFDMKNVLSGILSQIFNVISAINKIDLSGSTTQTEKKAGSQSNEFLNLAKSLIAFRDIVTDKFIETFDRFMLTFDKFLNIDVKKISAISVVLLTLSSIFNIIGAQVNMIAKGFKKLAVSILLVSFMMLSPLFILGAGVLVGVIWAISKALGAGTTTEKNTMLFAFGKFAFGIGILVVSLFAVAKVPFSAVLKLIGLIGLLSLVIRNFMGAGESSLSITKAGLSKKSSGNSIKGMIGFSIGIGLLVLSLAAVSDVPFTAAFKLIAFILALGVIFKVFYSGSPVKGKNPSMASFGFGMALIVLSLHAFGDVDWIVMFKFLSFMGVLGLIMKVMKPRKNILPFAWAMAVLTLAMWAIGDVPIKNLMLMVGFIAAISFVMSKFPITANVKLSGLAASILMLGISFWMVSKTNMSFKTFGMFVGMLAIFIGIVMLLGIPNIALMVKAGSIALVSMAGSIFLTTLIFTFLTPLLPLALLGAIGTIPLMGMFLVIAAMLVVITIPAVIGIVGALALLLMGTFLLGAIAIFSFMVPFVVLATIGVVALTLFVGLLWKPIWQLVLMTVPLAVATVGSILLMVFAATLLGSLTLFTVMTPLVLLATVGIKMVLGMIGSLFLISSLFILFIPIAPFAIVGSLLVAGVAAGISIIANKFNAIGEMGWNPLTGSLIVIPMLLSALAISLLLIVLTPFAILATVSSIFIATFIHSVERIVNMFANILNIINDKIPKGVDINTLFVTPVKNLVIGFGKLVGWAILGVVSATLITGFLTVALISTGLLWTMSHVIEGMKNPNNNAEIFVESVSTLIEGFGKMFGWAVLAIVEGVLISVFMGLAFIISTLLFPILFTVSKIPDAVDNTEIFIESVSIITEGFGKMFGWATLAIITGVLITPIMATAILGALALKAISEITIDKNAIQNYVNYVEQLVGGISDFSTIELIKSGFKSVLLLPILGVSILGALALKKISDVAIDKKKIVEFGGLMKFFITEITETIADSSQHLKKVKKGVDSLSKIVNVASELAKVVKEFSNLNFNEYHVVDGEIKLKAIHKIGKEEILQVGVNVGLLLEGLMKPLSVISSDDKKWNFGGGVLVDNPFSNGWFGTDNKAGVKRLALIGGAFTPLVEIVKGFSNMTFNEYNVVNGEVRVKAVHKIEDKHLIAIGHNVGALLQGLLRPLGIISGEDDMWDFGGKDGKMVNPFGKKGFFGGSGDKSGIKRIKLIGEAFGPLTDVIKNLLGNDIIQDQLKVEKIHSGLTVITSSFTQVFSDLSALPKKNVENSIDNIIGFAESLTLFDINKLNDFNDSMLNFVNIFSDTDKWERINKNLEHVGDAFKDISKHINSIELNKALAIERSLNSLAKSDNVNKLDEMIAKIEELINAINNKVDNTNVGSIVKTNETTPTNYNNNTKNNEISEEQALIQAENMLAVLKDIANSGNLTNQRLAGKLRVVNIDNQSNSI